FFMPSPSAIFTRVKLWSLCRLCSLCRLLERFDNPEGFVGAVFPPSTQAPLTDRTALKDAEFIADGVAPQSLSIIILVESSQGILQGIKFDGDIWCARVNKRLILHP